MASKGTELEPTIIEILLDPKIRQFCAQFLQPWMFQRTIHSHLVETLISIDFRDRPVDLKILRLHMQHTYSDIYSDDWQHVEDMYAAYKPVADEDIEAVTRIIASFIKNRVFLRGVDLFTKGDTKS